MLIGDSGLEQPFDSLAGSYDNWYDTGRGRYIFAAESQCLQTICPICAGRWLEVGVGTGRFAVQMGIREGIDPSSAMLESASSRGIRIYQGNAEDLPFEADSFDGILMAFTLCFVESPEAALSECYRVLKGNGRLLIGLIPAEGLWGKTYRQKKKQGHPIYSQARFLTIKKTMQIAKKSGFEIEESACTLFCKPDELPKTFPRIETGIDEQAGFAAMLFAKSI
jgi:ubiquinone/menaquinone biosynthesis C-methylase UbiE